MRYLLLILALITIPHQVNSGSNDLETIRDLLSDDQLMAHSKAVIDCIDISTQVKLPNDVKASLQNAWGLGTENRSLYLAILARIRYELIKNFTELFGPVGERAYTLDPDVPFSSLTVNNLILNIGNDLSELHIRRAAGIER